LSAGRFNSFASLAIIVLINSAQSKVFAVVVTFEPDPALLMRLLCALSFQVAGGIIVNNGCRLHMEDDIVKSTGFTVQHQQSNKGLATALNTGFTWAGARAADFVITFDQDSEPAADMIQRLLLAYQAMSAAGYRVGAVGPQQVDSRTGQCTPFILPVVWSRRRVIPIAGQSLEVDHLITSGCLVPMAAWIAVGPFLEDLFIDYVDVEWSLRSRHFGLSLFGVGGAYLNHTLGDAAQSWCFWSLPLHKPLRRYFMIRNGIYQLTLPYIPLSWKLFDAVQIVKRLIYFLSIGPSRMAQAQLLWRAITEGWQGKLGPASQKLIKLIDNL